MPLRAILPTTKRCIAKLVADKQVLDLMDEKNKLLALKVNAMGGTQRIPYVGASALTDDAIPTVANVVGEGSAAGGEGVGVVAGSASLSLDGDSVSGAAAAMAKATVEAKTLAEEKEISLATRFPKLSQVDLKYRDWQPPSTTTTLRSSILRKAIENLLAAKWGCITLPKWYVALLLVWQRASCLF